MKRSGSLDSESFLSNSKKEKIMALISSFKDSKKLRGVRRLRAVTTIGIMGSGCLLAPQAGFALDFTFSFGNVQGTIHGLDEGINPCNEPAPGFAKINCVVTVTNPGGIPFVLPGETFSKKSNASGSGFKVESGQITEADYIGVRPWCDMHPDTNGFTGMFTGNPGAITQDDGGFIFLPNPGPLPGPMPRCEPALNQLIFSGSGVSLMDSVASLTVTSDVLPNKFPRTTGPFNPAQPVQFSSVTPTPGPLPFLGASAAFGFSRKLRSRIKQHGVAGTAP